MQLALDVIKSISSSEDEILLGIMKLHNGGFPFDVDASYSVGGFYRNNVPQPKRKFDIDPQCADVEYADARALPLDDASVGSFIFDPPFMFAPHGSGGPGNATAVSRQDRFKAFATWEALVDTYQGALAEFYRVLEPGGIAAWKCQDYTDAKTTMTHCLLWQWASERGFYTKDFFIRFRMYGPAFNPFLIQKHARKFHSYWFVFQKPKGATDGA